MKTLLKQPATPILNTAPHHANPFRHTVQQQAKPDVVQLRFGESQLVMVPDPKPAKPIQYELYTPENTPSPLATYHTLYSPGAYQYHNFLGRVLEDYKRHDGRVHWLNNDYDVNNTPWAVFDIETTGLDSSRRFSDALRRNAYSDLRERIIQLASLVTTKTAEKTLNADPVLRLNRTINPGELDDFKLNASKLRAEVATAQSDQWLATVSEGRYQTFNDLETKIQELHQTSAGSEELTQLSAWQTQYNALWQQTERAQRETLKTFPIQSGATEVHGVKTSDVDKAEYPTMFDVVALQDNDGNLGEQLPMVEHFIRKQIRVGTNVPVAYNAKFDVMYLNKFVEAFNRSKGTRSIPLLDLAITLDPFILIQRIHPSATLSKKLDKHYEVIMGKTLDGAHDALVDVQGTIDVLKYVTRYLEKHTIPQPWALLAGQVLEKTVAKMVQESGPDKLPEGMVNEQGKLDPAFKMAFIARAVREHRELFEKAFPAEKSTVLSTKDILTFQFGTMPTHALPPLKTSEDQVQYENLPKLDIGLNILGWNGEKRWYGLRYDDPAHWDSYDPEIVQTIREERTRENGGSPVPLPSGGKPILDEQVIDMLFDGASEAALTATLANSQDQPAWYRDILQEKLGEKLTQKEDKKSRRKLQQPLIHGLHFGNAISTYPEARALQRYPETQRRLYQLV